MDVSRADFESLIADVIDAIPAPFDVHLARVPVVVVSRAPEPGLLGRYVGVPLPERIGGDPVEPSVIEIFMDTLVDGARTLVELREEVRITVLHELGHHLGMDEDDLHRLGYG